MKDKLFNKYLKYSLAFVGAVGMAVLLGYQFDIEVLRSVAPGYVAMNPLTAINFMVISLWLLIMLGGRKIKHFRRMFPPVVLAIVVLVISVLRAIDIISGTNLSVDDLMYKEVVVLGHMSPPAALCFLLLACVMIFTNTVRNTKGNFILFPLLIVLILSLLSLFGYLIGNDDIIMIRPFTTMAIHTTFCFLILIVNFIFLFPQNAFLKEVRSIELGGYSARTLIPYIILVPFALGFIAYFGEKKGVYTIGFGSAIQAVVAIIIFLFLVWRQAAILNEIDRQRKDAEKKTEEYSHNMEQFAFVASHDLKEPLRKISIFGDILRRSGDLKEKDKLNIDKVVMASTRMQKLVDDLLNFTQLRGAEAPTAIDLEKVIESVLTDFEVLIAEKNAVIQFEGLPRIEGVPFQINQLFYNLMGNALKFSNHGTAPVINISSAPLEDNEKMNAGFNSSRNYIHIRFSDNGIGFEQEYALKIFEMFKRVSGDKKFAGSGIGLALCKKIVSNHHGIIYADSELKKGTTFHILLPERL